MKAIGLVQSTRAWQRNPGAVAHPRWPKSPLSTSLRLFLLVSLVCLSGCSIIFPPKHSVIRLGIIAVTDGLPVYVARDSGYFAAEGIEVQIQTAQSAKERDALIEAGESDAMFAGLIETMLLDRSRPLVTSVANAIRAAPQHPVFRILSSPKSGLLDVSQLEGQTLAVSYDTVAEYVTVRLLAASGVKSYQLVPVIQLTARYELLMDNEVSAAAIVDPLAQAAIAQGAHLLVDDSSFPQYAQTVWNFRTEFLRANPNLVRAFLRALSRAMRDINERPEDYRQLLVSETHVPDLVQTSYSIPPFPVGELPTEQEWNDAAQWLVGKGLLAQPVPFASTVDGSYLPAAY